MLKKMRLPCRLKFPVEAVELVLVKIHLNEFISLSFNYSLRAEWDLNLYFETRLR